MDAVNFSLSVCINSFFGKIRGYEIFQVKVGTLKMSPILEDIQIGHKSRTTHANYVFEGVNRIVFMGFLMNKRSQPQIIYIFGVMLQSLDIFLYCLHLCHVFGP